MTDPDARRPDRTGSPALRPLANLPVFFRLSGKKVVIAGGSDAAAWKAELLAACGARVFVFDPRPGEKMRRLATSASGLVINVRQWTGDDLAGAALAIADLEHADEIGAFRQAARRHAAPVNIIDRPADCDFQFGAIVERSPLVIGISTDGAAPVFGQMLRMRIETLLPEGLRAWAEAAKGWRARIAVLGLDFRARRRVWEAFSRRALHEPQRTPDAADLDAMLAAAGGGPSDETGSVTLVGAGPGDPELLTLKAVRALQSADVVLYDDLVSPDIVAMARREADKVSVGKRGYKPSCTQEDITAMLKAYAGAGKRVVRLKGGDPMVFGRASEEIEALVAAGVRVEVVPGITAASAAAAFLGRSLTERQLARRVQFITAHARDGRLPDDFDWSALADPLATTVVYMGVRTLPALVERLLAEGLSPDTPAAIVERVSWPDERSISGRLADLPRLAVEFEVRAPSLTMIGAALRQTGTPA